VLRVTLLLLLALVLGAPLAASGGSNACPASNPPNTLVLVGGSTQTAQLGQAFAASFQVALANSNGCPLTGSLAGISVDFSAPSSGASGTFASNGSNVAVIGTDANGVAVAPRFIANDTTGTYSVEARSDYGTVKFSVTNTARGVAKTVVAAGLVAQSATVLGRYGQPLQATVLDGEGRPVQGASVSFSLGLGAYGAGATFVGGGGQASAFTDSSGRATSPPFTANDVSGPFTATASVAGVSEPVTYSLRNLAARTALAATAPQTRTATVATAYSRPLQATVRDSEGRPLEGASVTFALGTSTGGAGASFAGGGAQATVRTDANGVAVSPTIRANGVAGAFIASATMAGVTEPVSFLLRNVAGSPATIAAGVAASESTPVGSRFPIPLAVTVTDANKNPVGGVPVTFTAPAARSTGRFGKHGRTVRVTTNAAGVAVAPAFTAGRSPGGYVVTATVRGAKGAAAFALVNERR
jgi:adhesin/invasin